MLKIFLFSILSLVSLACNQVPRQGNVPNAEIPTENPFANAPVLRLDSLVHTVQDSIRDQRQNEARNQSLVKFQAAKDPISLFTIFQQELPDSGEVDFRLFQDVVNQTVLWGDTTQYQFAKRWTAAAYAEKRQRVRSLYSEYGRYLRGQPRRSFSGLAQTDIRPGGQVTYMRNYDWERKTKDSIRVQVARVILDANFNPSTVQVMDTMVFRSNTNVQWELQSLDTLPGAGIYRLTVLDPYAFQEDFIRVSWLDGMTKSDGETFMIWGSSMGNRFAPPYKVHIRCPNGTWVHAQTDAKGLYVARLQVQKGVRYSDMRVVLEKNGESVFVQGGFYQVDYSRFHPGYIWTDRPLYRPGQKLHWRGLVRDLDASGILTATRADSAKVVIMSPEYKEMVTKNIAIDRWGHFGDSTIMDSAWKQGRYQVFMRSLHTDTSWVDIYADARASFEIEAYRKPEFEVFVEPVAAQVFLSDSVRVRIRGAYFFGGPMANNAVEVRWYRKNMGWYGRFWPSGDRQILSVDSVVLDAKGAGVAAMLPNWTDPYTYVEAEVLVTDASRRQERASADIQVMKYDAFLDVNFDRWQYVLGDTAQLRGVVVDLKGKPLHNTVHVRIKTGSEIVDEQSVNSDAEGRFMYAIPLRLTGEYRVEVSTKDSRGAIVFVERGFSVVAKEERRWDWEQVEVVTDKQKYNVGDTALVTINTGAKDAHVLITSEGRRVARAYTAQFRNGSLRMRIPIDRRLGENANIQVVYSAKANMASGSAWFQIVDSSSLLKVKFEGKSVWKPGDTLDVNIGVADRFGKPSSAVFSVALVDDAIYALALQKGLIDTSSFGGILRVQTQWHGGGIRTEFARFDQGSVDWSNTGHAVGFGMGGATEAMLGGAGGSMVMKASRSKALAKMDGALAEAANVIQDLQSPAAPEVRVRSNFQDLAWWRASVTTDDYGQAHLRIPLPDDLTRWRLVLVGSDGKLQWIDARAFYETKRELMVKVEAPRVLVERDSFMVGAVVHNLSNAPMPVKVEMKIEGNSGVLRAPALQNITLAANATQKVEWPVLATQQGSLRFQATVRSANDADAEARSFPVIVHGIPQAKVESGILSAGVAGGLPSAQNMILEFPAKADPRSRELRIDYAPSLAQVLFQSLDYLTGFPYGCVEQTLSRFVPNLIVAGVSRELGIPQDSLNKMLSQYDSVGIMRLAEMQQPNGGWGWWRSDDADLRMTALVLDGLQMALQEMKVNPHARVEWQMQKIVELQKSGMPALKRLISMKGLNPQEQAGALKVLMQDPVLQKDAQLLRIVDALYRQRAKLDMQGLAMLLEAMYKLGRTVETQQLVTLLEGAASDDGTSVHWASKEQWGWWSQDEETTARVVMALNRTRPNSTLILRTIPWLVRQRNHGYWTSTKTTALVIQALAQVLRASGELKPNSQLEITQNGKSILKKNYDAKNLSDAGVILLKGTQVDSIQKIRVALSGKGRLYYTVSIRYVTLEEPIAAKGAELQVKRTYTVLRNVKNPNGKMEVVREAFTGKLQPNDELEVDLALTSSGSFEHVMLEDYFPQGMEVLEKPREWYGFWCRWWWWGYSQKEARDDRMVFFQDRISKGTVHFSYLLRAERPGLYHALPARAELMYNPEISANSAETIVAIE